jgi:hypothetical protein
MEILYRGELSDNVRNLATLGKCCGLIPECINILNFDSLISRLLMPRRGGILIDVASMEGQYDQDQLAYLAATVASRDLAILLVVTNATNSGNLFLRTVSDGAVRGVEAKTGIDRICFPPRTNHLTGELASHSYRRAPAEALGLAVDYGADVDALMNLNDAPSFVRVRIGNTSVFVWSTNKVFDACRLLTVEKEFEEAADQYIPAIIFLRAAFQYCCWHNPAVGAGLVIDDPLLRAKYGFIDFRKLLDSARKHQYHVTLAFIPWNHWRSRVKELKLFRDHSDCFSVCLHGCDHTNNEYGFTDYDVLLRKNFVARARMERHDHRTALWSEPLMVCPQERYSLEAMHAFSDSRQFLGLVCTACMPRNLASPQISAADLLLPAQDSFFGFPVFKRHYWKGMETFAMSLFLGKPAILVEHHEFFRNGSAGAEEFVRRLGEMRPGLKWASLLQTVTGTHARRHVSEGKWEVRFFTDTFHFKHSLEEPIHYRLLRRIPEAAVIERVLVDGTDVPFLRENDFLTFEVHAQHPQTVSVDLKIAPVRPTKAYSWGLKYQASVALRRGLSELRDNIASRNRFALRACRLLTKALKQASP